MILIPQPKHEEVIDQTNTMYPTKMISISDNFTLEKTIGNIYGFVTQGKFTIKIDGRYWNVQEGDFFSLKTSTVDESMALKDTEQGQMFWIVRYGFQGIDMVGASEKNGRLSYIDGCTDSFTS
jgi:hypothetical protein